VSNGVIKHSGKLDLEMPRKETKFLGSWGEKVESGRGKELACLPATGIKPETQMLNLTLNCFS